MRQHIKCIIIPFIVGILCSSVSQAQNSSMDVSGVPRIISYQGILSSATGGPLPSGEYTIGVSLYADEQGSELIWRGTYNAAVRDGLFDLQLGAGGYPLPDAAKMDRALWLGIRVGDGSEMTPRTPLRAAPYALTIPDGSVTADKIGTDYVSAITVNGQKVTAKGSAFHITGGEGIDLRYDPQTEGLQIGLSDDRYGRQADKEKGAGVLGTNTDFWTMQGDGRTDNGAVVAAAAGDMIGPLTAGVPFNITTGTGFAMVYQPSTTGGAFDNVVGGNGNAISAASDASIIAGGGGIGAVSNNILGGSNKSTISGGETNTIGVTGPPAVAVNFSTIGGGQSNTISAGTHGSIGGGQSNLVTAGRGTVGGGQSNQAQASHSTVGGGQLNQAQATHSVVAGGSGNQAQAGFSGVAAGQTNTTTDNWSFVGGGTSNQAGNGGPNQLDAQFATVGGGQSNTAQANNGTIGGGLSNDVTDDFSTIGGGDDNQAGNAAGTLLDAAWATVGGGRSNVASGQESTIGGGNDNLADGFRSTVGGGFTNSAMANRGTIGGGEFNTVGFVPPIGMGTNPLIGQYATVGGGSSNTAIGDYSTIAGGSGNGSGGNFAAVGGGLSNAAGALYTTVGGGRTNGSFDEYATIGGGFNNISGSNDGTTNNAPFTTVGGGELNEASDDYAAIGGGYENDASGTYSTIGGGDDNAASGDASTVGGGRDNQAIVLGGTVAGGEHNLVNDDYSTIGGGKNNLAGTAVGGSLDQTFSTVAGGEENFAKGAAAAIPGGRYLEIGDFSFGFNGDPNPTTTATRTNISQFPRTAYFGEVDIWMGNVNGTPKEFRFYGPNTSYAYNGVGNPGNVTAKYTGFKAGAVTANSVYTLPTNFPAGNGALLASSTTGVMSWQSVPLPASVGGTGGTATPTAWGVAYGTGTALAYTAAGTAGQVLTSNGTAAPTWQAVNATSWKLTGNALTNPLSAPGGTDFIGTSDVKDLVIATNGTNRVHIASGGAVTVAGAMTVSGALTASGGVTTTGNSTVSGTVTASGGLTVSAGGATVTGSSSVTGSLNLAGTTSPLLLNGSAGTAGYALVSNGAGNTPSWTAVVGNWNNTGNNTTTGKLGLSSSATPLVSADVNGALAVRASNYELITANRTITVGDRSYIRIGSNAAPGATRIASLSDGLQAGQILVIECIGDCDNPYTGTQGFRLLSSDNVRLTGNATKDFVKWDNITLIWDPSPANDSGNGRWVEIGYRNH